LRHEKNTRREADHRIDQRKAAEAGLDAGAMRRRVAESEAARDAALRLEERSLNSAVVPPLDRAAAMQ